MSRGAAKDSFALKGPHTLYKIGPPVAPVATFFRRYRGSYTQFRASHAER